MKHLLLIDIDRDCEAVVSKAASQLGYDLLITRVSREALGVIRNRVKDLALIVVDLDPGAHGVTLLEAINGYADRPPMIVLTALEEMYMCPIAAAHGATACLGKPVRTPQLRAAMEQAVKSHSLTSDRWGSPVPPVPRKLMTGHERFPGITAKLGPTRKASR